MTNVKTSIRINVNGKPWVCFSNTTLNELINNLRLDKSLIAIERNKKVVSPSLWSKTYLDNDDTIEIIAIVGGG
uniref:Thiamine biosynthesis protein ThiS n=1 Tax=Cyanidium caldarium TaxID=2771 RepID=Q9TLZ4_CYACA|nr:hypothetical protein JXY51_pgp098 [Cyanidium caldarium]AAF12971.1 unknown [Cyanidium caldarium]WDB00248.1 thiamine-biosynthesis [Cyanidium caldarium]